MLFLNARRLKGFALRKADYQAKCNTFKKKAVR
jgi:hypothetical protein